MCFSNISRRVNNLSAWVLNFDVVPASFVIADCEHSKRVLHSSFRNFNAHHEGPIAPYRNGFVDGVMRAFQQDLHLVLRPDDVWLAILTQFSFYVNKNAEELRDQFVAHQGKEELVVEDHTRPCLNWDIGSMSKQFATLKQEKVINPSVRDWLVPVFSTTTDLDLAVSSMVLKSGWGFPSVTLLGEVEDWQKILTRLDQLAEYGEQPAKWSRLLVPVLKRFIASFYMPDSTELKKFWMQAVHSDGALGSGPLPTYNGWLTAFMYWDNEGYCQRSKDIVVANDKKPPKIDGEVYPLIYHTLEGVPSGVVEISVTVKALDLGLRFKTRIIAGSMGMTVTNGSKQGSGTMVQPCPGWWMVEYSRESIGRV
ncbi:hypothetical protein P153DRAFT_379286 [Dothidotthia symphoricarpi CBS 119687]|uniref:Uncharacterized protein n=1 Tax=Dothidotthia symphoricarpi CBS 119687 TaxID=1392245 RepID=A0A6A6A0H5_9PLEO|nr:uncharacterized protein P153DRAFT_379286 [Dothidotthia symphoricarpi CBS 119687]KAF2124653.1 hypothetical protein P153DRAFT_379286 [Dothidotthia symphoricarpi CBS 119687]